MCRALSYVGPPIPLADLLHRPDNSLIRQAIAPRYLPIMNLAGFGMLSWNAHDAEPERPLSYQSTTIPVFDANLESLAIKLTTTSLIAHVRGVPYRTDPGFGLHNLHPFRYPGVPLALAHNGTLADFPRMRTELHRRISPAVAAQMRGTTDSEHMYALILSELPDSTAVPTTSALLGAMARALTTIRQVREALGIDTSSSTNLFLTDGRRQVALRHTFDFGCYPLDPERMHEASSRFVSLWYTVGAAFAQAREEGGGQEWRMQPGAPRAAILASEPLTGDTSGWVEVPEYSAVVVEPGADGISLDTFAMDV